MRALERFACRIDTINEWAGKISAWFIVPLTLIVTLDVILRYVFNRPTTWAWDINVQFLAVLVIMGGGYVLLKGGHIGVDVLVAGLSQRKRAMVDVALFPLLAFTFGVLLWKSAIEAWTSIKIGELFSGVFNPPIYPLRVVIAIGVALLLLQGAAVFTRNLLILMKKTGQAEHER